MKITEISLTNFLKVVLNRERGLIRAQLLISSHLDILICFPATVEFAEEIPNRPIYSQSEIGGPIRVD